MSDNIYMDRPVWALFSLGLVEKMVENILQQIKVKIIQKLKLFQIFENVWKQK